MIILFLEMEKVTNTTLHSQNDCNSGRIEPQRIVILVATAYERILRPLLYYIKDYETRATNMTPD